MNIYVANLPYDSTNEGLQELFEGFGEVASVNIIKDRNTGRSRGFGFVEMPNPDEAKNAIEQLQGKDFDGRVLNVNEARPRKERSDGFKSDNFHRDFE